MNINKIIQKKLLVEKFGFSDCAINVLEIGSGKPKTAIINGLHGLEKAGGYLGYYLYQTIDLKSGTLAFIPFANPTSVQNNTRLTPEDSQDLNRIFPGKKDGTLSFRIAHILFEYLKDFDLVIDIHNFPKMTMPFIGVFFVRGSTKQSKEVLNLLTLFKPDYIWKLDTAQDEKTKAGSLVEALLNYGTLAFALETPDIELLTQQQEEQFSCGLQQIMVYLSQKSKWIKTKNYIPVITRTPVLSPGAGFFIPKKEVGSFVKRGERIGELVSMDNFTNYDIISTLDGPVIFILQKTFVNPADRVAIIGNPAKI